jgi:hypothetical protein
MAMSNLCSRENIKLVLSRLYLLGSSPAEANRHAVNASPDRHRWNPDTDCPSWFSKNYQIRYADDKTSIFTLVETLLVAQNQCGISFCGTTLLAICRTLCSKHIRRHDRAFESGRRDHLEQEQGGIVEIST